MILLEVFMLLFFSPNIGKDNLDWFGMENKFIYRPFGKDLQQFPEVIQNITAPIFQALVVNMKQAKDKKLVLATGCKLYSYWRGAGYYIYFCKQAF